ncbi:MAG: ligase-associated DNA damage response endonuclease PdeM [Desulfobacterales bacterium]|jgi:DNA ligase-associated metallophosphoesterase
MKGTKEIELFGQRLMLLSERAVFWKQAKMLIVADPHFGKAQVFRDSGIPIPGGTTAADIGRISSLMEWLQPNELLFLGDLMHGRIDGGRNFSTSVDAWRRRWSGILLTLVTGNHDLKAGPLPAPFRLDRIGAQHVCGPFVFSHNAETTKSLSRYTIAGHVHPAVFVSGKAHQRDSLPCFCFGEKRALLPAFGSFTGNQVIRPKPQERVYVVAGDEVVEIM